MVVERFLGRGRRDALRLVSVFPSVSSIYNGLALIEGTCSTGLQPYVARDLMQFPVCIPGEGLMDVVVQSLVRSLRGVSKVCIRADG
jgi:hypothetical protein